ncbi:MAG: hypothetical protein J0H68_01605 [Sphingobacteriia bacterium]|nr:hypothetical protein [Sphingobacteriia bacterium]
MRRKSESSKDEIESIESKIKNKKSNLIVDEKFKEEFWKAIFIYFLSDFNPKSGKISQETHEKFNLDFIKKRYLSKLTSASLTKDALENNINILFNSNGAEFEHYVSFFDNHLSNVFIMFLYKAQIYSFNQGISENNKERETPLNETILFARFIEFIPLLKLINKDQEVIRDILIYNIMFKVEYKDFDFRYMLLRILWDKLEITTFYEIIEYKDASVLKFIEHDFKLLELPGRFQNILLEKQAEDKENIDLQAQGENYHFSMLERTKSKKDILENLVSPKLKRSLNASHDEDSVDNLFKPSKEDLEFLNIPTSPENSIEQEEYKRNKVKRTLAKNFFDFFNPSFEEVFNKNEWLPDILKEIALDGNIYKDLSKQFNQIFAENLTTTEGIKILAKTWSNVVKIPTFNVQKILYNFFTSKELFKCIETICSNKDRGRLSKNGKRTSGEIYLEITKFVNRLWDQVDALMKEEIIQTSHMFYKFQEKFIRDHMFSELRFINSLFRKNSTSSLPTSPLMKRIIDVNKKGGEVKFVRQDSGEDIIKLRLSGSEEKIEIKRKVSTESPPPSLKLKSKEEAKSKREEIDGKSKKGVIKVSPPSTVLLKEKEEVSKRNNIETVLQKVFRTEESLEIERKK